MRSKEHHNRFRPLSHGETGPAHRRREGDGCSSSVSRTRPPGVFRFPLVPAMRRSMGRHRFCRLDVSSRFRPRVPDPLRTGKDLHGGRRPGSPPPVTHIHAGRDPLSGRFLTDPHNDPRGAPRTVPGTAPGRPGARSPAPGRKRQGRKTVDRLLPLPARLAGRGSQTDNDFSFPVWKVNRVRERLTRIPSAIMFVSIEEPP